MARGTEAAWKAAWYDHEFCALLWSGEGRLLVYGNRPNVEVAAFDGVRGVDSAEDLLLGHGWDRTGEWVPGPADDDERWVAPLRKR